MTSRCGQHSRPAQMVFGFVKSLKRAMRRDHIIITSWPRVILAGFCRTTGNNGSFRDWSGLVWPQGLRECWCRTNCKQPSHLLALSRRSSRSCEVIASHLSMTTSRMFMLRVGSGSMQCWPMRVSIGRRLRLDRCDADFPPRLPTIRVKRDLSGVPGKPFHLRLSDVLVLFHSSHRLQERQVCFRQISVVSGANDLWLQLGYCEPERPRDFHGMFRPHD